MAVTVTDDSAVIDAAENSGSWAVIGNASSQATDAIRAEGTTSVAARINGTGVNGLAVSVAAGQRNMAGKLLLMWALAGQRVDTLALGGWRLRISSSAGAASNYREFDVAGRDTMVGQNSGFQCFAVETDGAGTRDVGTAPATSNVLGVAVVANMLTSNGRVSYYADQAKIINKTFIKGGTVLAKGASSEISSDDQSVARGTFQFIGGSFFLMGEIVFGDTTAATDSFFADSAVDWLFQDMPVGLLHGITFVGGTGTNEFTLGAKIGTGVSAVGAGGGLIHRATPTSARFFFTAIDANVAVNLYGLTLVGGQKVRLEQANVEALGCLFSDCDTVSVRNGCLLRSGSIITDSSAITAEAALDLGATDPALDTVRDIQVNNNATGILLKGTATGTTTYNFRNIKFAGNTVDVRIDFPAAATVIINILDGGTASPTTAKVNAGTTVTINAPVNVSLSNVVSGTTFNMDGIFTTAVPVGAFNGLGDSSIRMTGTIPTAFASAGDVRLFNGSYYEVYAYTGHSGTDLTGVTPTLSQDFNGSKALMEMVAPKAVTLDPHVESVVGGQQFEIMLANASGTPAYIPVFFEDNTGSGFSRRLSQIQE